MLTKDEILRKLEESRGEIEGYGVRRIGLFGSYVRNEQKVDSDVDLLVEFDEGQKSFSNYMDLRIFLEELFGCRVDLVIAEDVKPLLRPDITREVVYA
jgi:hypothetical protein